MQIKLQRLNAIQSQKQRKRELSERKSKWQNRHPINGLMGTSMEKIRELVDVNTIIGDPITSPDGTIIIPVSKVSFGFVAGGSDLPTKAPKEVLAGGKRRGHYDKSAGFYRSTA